MDIKKIALSQIKIQIALSKFRVLDLQIENQSNTHGKMLLKLELDEEITMNDVLRLEGSNISAMLPNQGYLFVGVCTNISYEEHNGYKTIWLEVCTFSWLMDREQHTQTFQSPSKSLKDIIEEIIARYNGLFRLQNNPAISTVIYQQRETDWEFLKRIANQYRQEIYVNTQSSQLDIAIGTTGMKIIPAEEKLQLKEVSKEIGEQRMVMANTDPCAVSYQFIKTEYLCEDLTIIPGDAIGKETIKANSIVNVSGELENRIIVAKTADTKATYEEETSTVGLSSILTGTVLKVAGNNIQVQLDADACDMSGNCVEMPYESAISNSFYCMPDEGDQVFIYYENNGTMVCLGSKRSGNAQDDYKKPDEKVLTSKDKMIRFTSKAVKLTDTRKKHDEEDDTEISILLDDDDGITITSGSDVNVMAEDSGSLALIALASDYSVTAAQKSLIEGKNKYNSSFGSGDTLYRQESGMGAWDQFKKATGEQWSRFGRDLESNFKSTVDSFTFKNIRDLLNGTLGEEGTNKDSDSDETKELEEEENQYETGVVTIYGLNTVTFQVRESFLILDADIYVNAPQFSWLGYTKGRHDKIEEEYQDGWALALDGLQLALDLCGMIPVYGVFFDIANAAISLARGDVCGAAMSLLCAIPAVGEACAVLKIGGKGAKAAIKVAEMVKSAPRILKIAKLIYSGVSLTDQGIGIGASGSAIFVDMMEGKFDFSNPNDWARGVNLLRSGVGMYSTGKDMCNSAKELGVGENGSQRKNNATDTQQPQKQNNDADIQQPQKQNNATDTQQPRVQNNDGAENQATICDTTGDPINIVTGSLMAEYVDLGLEDVLGSFDLKRFYESVYNNRGGILGDKWRFELESSVQRMGNLAVLQMPDLHLERFVKDDGVWRNQRTEDASLLFSETTDGYLLKICKTGELYEYDASGKLTVMSDIHGNKKKLTYEAGQLQRITLASGLWVDFFYQDKKLVRIKDCLDREVVYDYTNNYLTGVRLPNGGTMHYEYTKEGFMTAITDLNGKCYSRNFYDRKGRVIRQELEGGEEYVAFYDDANRQNTFLTTSTGENNIYTYGKEQLITRIQYPDGTTEERRYDDGKNIVYEKDRLDRETFREFNEAGMLIKEQLPDGLTKYLEYDQRNQPVHVWDNAGREIRNRYDETGNMVENRVRQNEKTELVTSFTYDKRGRIRTITDPEGNTQSYNYDTAFSEPSLYTTAFGADIKYCYDAGGNLMEKTDAYGSTTYGYNAMGHCTIRRDPEGNTTRYFYDNMANLVKEILPNAYNPVTDDGPGREFAFDVWTYLSRVVEADGGVYHYENDFRGNCLRQWSPRETYGVEEPGIRYEYDINHNRIRTIFADGGVLREVYDVCGNLIKRILPENYDKETDDGVGYSYSYDACNRLIEITNPMGIVEMRYVYDLCGNIIKEIPTKGYLMGDTDETRIGTLYRYDLRGNVTEIRIPQTVEDGKVNYRLTTFLYDKCNNCVEEKRYLDYQTQESARGRVNVIRYSYDKGGRLVTINDSTGAQMEYAYDERNQRIMEKQKICGGIWQERHYEYSPAGNIIRVAESADEKGCGRKYVSTRYTYDKNGNITRIQTPAGNEILREYDVCDRLTAETHKEKNGSIHNRTTYTYDKMGNLTQVCSQGEHTTQYTYDRMNRLTEETDSDGGTILHRYNRNGNLTCRIYPEEYAQQGDKATGYRYTYDILGRITDIHSPEGSHIQKTSYNMFGETDHEGDGISGVSISYDFAGRRSKITTDGGRSQEYCYDALGNIVGVKDGNGNTTTYVTDLWGRITTLTTPDGSHEQYTYDEAGNVLTATDGNGNTVTYRFNCINKLAERIDAAGEAETFFYDMEGRMCEHTDRNGMRSIYRYNMYGSPTLHQSTQTGLTESWEYDSMGRLKSAIGGGMRYEYSYYPNGLLKEKKASGRTLLSYAYDLDGNKVSRRDITGKETGYVYNKDGQLTGVTDNGQPLAAYRYHADGNVESLTIGKGLTTRYGYDTDRNLQSLQTTDGDSVLADSTFVYDANANRVEKKGLEGLTRYSYDACNRLIEVQYPHILGSLKDEVERFGYDAAGNRTLRETCEQTEQYRYDNCNRLTKLEITPKDASKAHSSVSYQYDKQGNLLSDGNNTYSYDGFNRMAQVQTAEGRIQKNSYDAEGLRHEMEENGQLVKFLYNENREVEAEEESTGNIIRYIRGLGLISSDSENARTYYHYVSDEQGSITHMVDGENGTIPNHYTYDAFGNTIHCEEQVHNRFRYNGEQYDPVTSQYYLRARFYNPAIARFIQEDTYYGDGLNLYRYCANNPVEYQDPSGHNICPGQLDLYKKYRAEGMSPREAYDRMRTELGLSSKNPFTKDSEGGTVSVLQRQLEARYGKPSGDLAYQGDTDSTLFDTFGVQPGRNVDLANPSAPNNRSYITYIFRNQSNEIVYVGRASGNGNPIQVMKGRISKGHEHFKAGYSYEIVATQTNKLANQGAEEFFILGYQEMGMKLENITPSLSYKSDRVGKTMNKIEAFFEDLFR